MLIILTKSSLAFKKKQKVLQDFETQLHIARCDWKKRWIKNVISVTYSSFSQPKINISNYKQQPNHKN